MQNQVAYSRYTFFSNQKFFCANQICFGQLSQLHPIIGTLEVWLRGILKHHVQK
jgi:hypothetical protein